MTPSKDGVIRNVITLTGADALNRRPIEEPRSTSHFEEEPEWSIHPPADIFVRLLWEWTFLLVWLLLASCCTLAWYVTLKIRFHSLSWDERLAVNRLIGWKLELIENFLVDAEVKKARWYTSIWWMSIWWMSILGRACYRLMMLWSHDAVVSWCCGLHRVSLIGRRSTVAGFPRFPMFCGFVCDTTVTWGYFLEVRALFPHVWQFLMPSLWIFTVGKRSRWWNKM